MWWPFNKRNNNTSNENSATADLTSSPVNEQPVFTGMDQQQTPINGSKPVQDQQEPFSTSNEVKSYISTLTPQNFYLSNLVTIPCFREAGLSGFSCFFVFSSVIYFYHRNFRKAVNWGFGALLLGSIFGWESCNNQRRNSQMAVRLAQERFEKKQSEK